MDTVRMTELLNKMIDDMNAAKKGLMECEALLIELALKSAKMRDAIKSIENLSK